MFLLLLAAVIASRSVTTPSVALIASPVPVTVMSDIRHRVSIDSIWGRHEDLAMGDGSLVGDGADGET